MNYNLYTNDEGKPEVGVRNSQISPDLEYIEVCGYALQPDPQNPGDLEVYFPGCKNFLQSYS